MGGTYVGPSMTELPGWRVGILFALFSLITLIWGKGVRALDRHFRRKGKRGLRHVLRALQEELLALGVTSLVLVAFEVRPWVADEQVLPNTPELQVPATPATALCCWQAQSSPPPT